MVLDVNEISISHHETSFRMSHF